MAKMTREEVKRQRDIARQIQQSAMSVVEELIAGGRSADVELVQAWNQVITKATHVLNVLPLVIGSTS